MRKVIFGGASSLDGYFARADHSTDWILWNDEVAAAIAAIWKRIDTCVMGRKTYETGLSKGHWEKLPAGVKVYVFSRTLGAGVAGNVEIVADEATRFIGDLKRRDGQDICVMGGGELARSLLEGGLLDEIGFTIHPLLLGSGVPLFHPMTRQIDLELIGCKPLTNGCVDVTYRIKHRPTSS
jgi:dihydrofolate reductase